MPFKSFVTIDPIRTIDIGNFDLLFDPGHAWSPSAESNSVQASLGMPSFLLIQLCIDFFQSFLLVSDWLSV